MFCNQKSTEPSLQWTCKPTIILHSLQFVLESVPGIGYRRRWTICCSSMDLQAHSYSSLVAICFGIGSRNRLPAAVNNLLLFNGLASPQLFFTRCNLFWNRFQESVTGSGWVKWFLSKTNLFVWMDEWTDDGSGGIKGCFISHPQEF